MTPWTDPVPDARRAGWRVPFGQRLLRVETAGGVRWLTPAQLGMSDATIAAVEAAEAEGDARRQRVRRSA